MKLRLLAPVSLATLTKTVEVHPTPMVGGTETELVQSSNSSRANKCSLGHLVLGKCDCIFPQIYFNAYLFPVGRGPSLKTCPWWAWHRAHFTSFRTMPCEISVVSQTWSGSIAWGKWETQFCVLRVRVSTGCSHSSSVLQQNHTTAGKPPSYQVSVAILARTAPTECRPSTAGRLELYSGAQSGTWSTFIWYLVEAGPSGAALELRS